MSTPRPRQPNITTGTHGGLTFCSLGIGGVYRPDDGMARVPDPEPDRVPFGVARPPLCCDPFAIPRDYRRA
jgi:hypothetical protein